MENLSSNLSSLESSHFEYIDIHVHAAIRSAFPRDWTGTTFPTPEQLINRYDALGIKKGCVLPLISPEARRSIQSNAEILAACEQFPDRLIPFCNIDPRMIFNNEESPFQEMLYFFEDKGCKGVGEITVNLPFTHPLVKNLFRAIEMIGFPLIFHIAPSIGGTYGLYDDPGLPLLEETLKNYPNLTFLGHSQAFWAEIGELKNPELRKEYPKGLIKKEGRVIELMRKYPNLHADLSAYSGFNAISRDEEFGLNFLEEFQDKVYFGTDITAPNGKAPLLHYLERLKKEGKIKTSVFKKIMFENAKKILKL